MDLHAGDIFLNVEDNEEYEVLNEESHYEYTWVKQLKQPFRIRLMGLADIDRGKWIFKSGPGACRHSWKIYIGFNLVYDCCDYCPAVRDRK